MKNTNLYQTITNRILTALDQGIIPWKKPFKSNFSAIPVNYATGKSYRGINILLLNLTGWHMGYPSNAWLTFQQAKQLGGSVKKGERSETIVFWKPTQVTVEEPDNEEKTRQTIYIARSYSVFNIDQCQGLNLKEQPVRVPTIDSAEQVYANFPGKRPTLQTGNKAAYYPRLDQVRIPAMQDFESSSAYYATLFHELVHSTGHNTRLNRDSDRGCPE